MRLVKDAISQNALGKLAWLAFDMAKELIKATRGGKIAVIIDDAFQILGTKESAIYVKALLNLIEYPPAEYERVLTIVATSEGSSRREIGRHTWAHLDILWNMPKEGFKQLYNQIPGSKPDFDTVWRLTGGNPRMLGELIVRGGWDTGAVTDWLIESKTITQGLINKWRSLLEKAIEDPDILWSDAPEELLNELTEHNLIIYPLSDRDSTAWVDQPPPERDPELGIGKHVAWQSPLHREAIKRALQTS